MVKFVDLEKGFIYDGHKPYIFWFNDGLSTDLIYTKSIGVFSDKLMINISLPSNPVFKLINIEELLKNLNAYKSSECLEYTSAGFSVPNGYLHIIYLSACSNENGEFHESLYIDNHFRHIQIKEAIELPDKDILIEFREIYDSEDFEKDWDESVIYYKKLSEIELTYFPCDDNIENWE